MKAHWAGVVPIAGVLLVGCSSQAAGSEDAMFACASTYALDQSIQAVMGGQAPNPEAAQTLMSSMQVSADDAARANAEYGQLALLVAKFVRSIEQRSEEAAIDIVAIEGECEQLGFGID